MSCSSTSLSAFSSLIFGILLRRLFEQVQSQKNGFTLWYVGRFRDFVLQAFFSRAFLSGVFLVRKKSFDVVDSKMMFRSNLIELGLDKSFDPHGGLRWIWRVFNAVYLIALILERSALPSLVQVV